MPKETKGQLRVQKQANHKPKQMNCVMFNLNIIGTHSLNDCQGFFIFEGQR